MPVYIYRCQNCGTQFEKAQTYFDKPLIRCGNCHRNTLQRVLNVSAVIFKGSGWYSIDQRSNEDQRTRMLFKNEDKTQRHAGETSKNGVLK